jgi:hypothetical protein
VCEREGGREREPNRQADRDREGDRDKNLVCIGEEASVTMINVTLTKCVASGAGGAVFLGQGSSLSVVGGVISQSVRQGTP